MKKHILRDSEVQATIVDLELRGLIERFETEDGWAITNLGVDHVRKSISPLLSPENRVLLAFVLLDAYEDAQGKAPWSE